MRDRESRKELYKEIRIFAGAMIVVAVIIYAVCWCANGGFIQRKPLTTDYQSETNPIMREDMVKECNEVTGVVIDFNIRSNNNIYDVYLDLGDEYPFVMVLAYCRREQVKYLHVGDTVVVTGKLKYSMKEDYSGNVIETLLIGDAIGIPPFAFRANITKIDS